jgi:hypothetical protein
VGSTLTGAEDEVMPSEPLNPSAGALLPDRGQVWEAPYTAHERVVLNEQAKYDRRYLPPVWYWRLLRPDDAGGTAPDETLFESPRVTRRYAAPIAVHLYVDMSDGKKGKKKGAVETTGNAKLGVSRAEARRLGALLKTADDSEGLTFDAERKEPLFIPRPEDVFLYRERYFEVVQLSPEWLGTSRVVVTWQGTCHVIRDDSTAPGPLNLPAPPSTFPPRQESVPWQR